MFLDLEKKSLIIESCIIIVTVFSLIKFYDVKKWGKNKVEKIVLKIEIHAINWIIFLYPKIAQKKIYIYLQEQGSL